MLKQNQILKQLDDIFKTMTRDELEDAQRLIAKIK